MNFLILLLLALKGLRVFTFNYPHNVEQNSNEVDVVNYNDMGRGSCPKIKQPLCATNGVETLYFDNKCFLEVKNFEQLMQGLQGEYKEEDYKKKLFEIRMLRRNIYLKNTLRKLIIKI